MLLQHRSCTQNTRQRVSKFMRNVRDQHSFRLHDISQQPFDKGSFVLVDYEEDVQDPHGDHLKEDVPQHGLPRLVDGTVFSSEEGEDRI